MWVQHVNGGCVLGFHACTEYVVEWADAKVSLRLLEGGLPCQGGRSVARGSTASSLVDRRVLCFCSATCARCEIAKVSFSGGRRDWQRTNGDIIDGALSWEGMQAGYRPGQRTESKEKWVDGLRYGRVMTARQGGM